MVGESLRKLPSLSSASATRNSPWPSLAFVPRLFSLPPITTVGSMPPAASTVATMEVVVVLPCAPGDGDAVLQPHELGEHLGPRDDRDLLLPRRDHLDVVVLHGRGDHHHVRRGDVLGPVADGRSRRPAFRAAPWCPTPSGPSPKPCTRGSGAPRRCRSCRCRRCRRNECA